MPKILIYRNLVFIIFSVDIYENRMHIHVVKRTIKKFIPAKFWVEPKIELAKPGDFSTKELNEIQKIMEQQKELITTQLELFFHGKRIKLITLKK